MSLHTAAEWEVIGKHIKPDEIVLHHTTGPEDQTLEAIDDEHRARGWAGEGYHGLFTRAGGKWHFVQGRPDNIEGAQAQGANYHSVGYAVAGNYMTHLPPKECLDLIVQVLATKAKRLGIKVVDVIGHRDVSARAHNPSVATACPGDALYKWLYTDGRKAIGKYL